MDDIETVFRKDEEDSFFSVVALLTHILEELVDDPDSLYFTSALAGSTGVIEVVGPQDEVSKIFGSGKGTISAVETIARNVAAKNGFKVFITVLNSEFKNEMLNRSIQED